jgi:hypothetical protein
MVDLFDTMVDLPDTMVDHPDTMVDLPDTMVDLPDTMSHISSSFFPFHLVFPIHSSLFFKFNSRSLALIALALLDFEFNPGIHKSIKFFLKQEQYNIRRIQNEINNINSLDLYNYFMEEKHKKRKNRLGSS